MHYSKQELWQRFQDYYTEWPALGLALDLSRMNFPKEFFDSIEPRLQKAFAAMSNLEQGAIANPDENRMVGHYWLRDPALAPTAEIRNAIETTILKIKDFTSQVHRGVVAGAHGPFKNFLLIGIGGSVLGPQFVSKALGSQLTNKLKAHFLDNTDPDGFDNSLSELGESLGQTLCIIVSKSGGTKETRNGMLETKVAYEKHGLSFASHAVAVTGANSDLDKYASQNQWLDRFPMWDWVGGRTSELSAVGLLPAALQGFDIDSIISGAKACDEVTRTPRTKSNPAAQLAAMWFYSGNGKGSKNMVVLPYKDRLDLFSRYLQQLVMESLGKRLDLQGNVVNQGLTVLGNKGSTDQHAYIQQLRDGLDNFFVTFIEVLKDRAAASMMVEPNATSGDFLNGFFQGTRQALFENGRESVTITVNETFPFSIGALIALFERTVGFYATLVNVNAYHQPGVEAGKKAASSILDLQTKILMWLAQQSSASFTPPEIASGIGAEDVEAVFKICEHLSANPDRGVRRSDRSDPFTRRYSIEASS
jgi:glucose-6-phosphate isomerase